MAQLPLGSTKTQFNQSFIYIDPQYITGLDTWRPVLIPPNPSDVFGLGAILPIVSTDLGPQSIQISFDIANLSSISAAATNKSLLTRANGLIQEPPESLPGYSPKTQNIVTIDPVQNVIAADKAVLYFDITSLDRAPIKAGTGVGDVDTSREKYRVVVKDYNNSNGVNIDSKSPMVDELIGNTATFSFDITTLPKV